MSEPETKNVGRDALGIAVFGVAIFAAISVVMSLVRPVENPGGTTAAVHLLVAAIGAVPGLALAAGLAWLGARMWLAGRVDDAPRNLVGVAGTTLGLAVLAGAAVAEAGGAFGSLTGGTVSAFMSPLIGVPFGLVCFLIPIWFVWIRPRDLISWNLGQSEDAPAAPSTEAEGVSAAEAEALLPQTPEFPVEELRDLERPASTEPPISPYPPDVRLQGEIPDGARPLEARAAATRDEPTAGAADDVALPEQPVVQGAWTPPERAGADLAEPEPTPDPAVAEIEPPDVAVEGTGVAAAEAAELAPPPAIPPEAEAQPIEAAAPPRPSWEQSDLFEEEPVDAYGTPLSVLEARGSETPAVVDPPDLAEEDEREELSLAEIAATDAPAAPAAEETSDDVVAAEEETEDEEDVTEVHAEDEEDDEEEEYEDEEEEEEEASEVHAEGEEEDEEEEYEDEEEEEEASEVHAEGEEEDEEEEYEDEEEEEEEASEVHAEGEEDDEEEEYEDEEEEEYDEDEEEAAEDETEEVVAEDEEPESEPQVEIQPQAAPAPAPTPAPASSADAFPSDEFVHRAGALFIERERVAVSMLQREFELDFKQATQVLDRLQEAGLIGPYMGGQRRDILLTAEEWEQRAGTF